MLCMFFPTCVLLALWDYLPHNVGMAIMAREQDSGSNQCIHVQRICGETLNSDQTQNGDYKVLGAGVSLPLSTVALSVQKLFLK